jgi:hypothetical protein
MAYQRELLGVYRATYRAAGKDATPLDVFLGERQKFRMFKAITGDGAGFGATNDAGDVSYKTLGRRLAANFPTDYKLGSIGKRIDNAYGEHEAAALQKHDQLFQVASELTYLGDIVPDSGTATRTALHRPPRLDRAGAIREAVDAGWREAVMKPKARASTRQGIPSKMERVLSKENLPVGYQAPTPLEAPREVVPAAGLSLSGEGGLLELMED